MNRRSFLENFSPISPKNEQTIAMAAPPATVDRPTSGIESYTGAWNASTAKRLLRVTMFGPKKVEIDLFTALNLNLAVTKILSPLPVLVPPLCIQGYGGDTTNLPFHFSNSNTNQYYRKLSLQAWTVGNILNQEPSVGEKMLLFWQNHLVTGVDSVNDARYTYYYIELLRKHALGNVKTLVKEISTNAAMLKYLSGDKNKKGSPNENYARELMELFTLGSVDVNGNPNYTEPDVEEAAKVLTGWQTVTNGNGTFLSPHTKFNANEHETGPKTFSAHFGNRIIHRSLPTDYAKELDDLIDMIFDRKEVALFLVRQLYTWFVYYEIDALTEANVIEPLADILRNNDYELKPVLEKLFKSQHFYDALAAGTVVKTPADYVLGTIRQMEMPIPLNFPQELNYLYLRFHEWMVEMQMELLNPPNVAGWSAYYQSPEYYQRWINTATYNSRSTFANQLLRWGIYSATYSCKPNYFLFANTLCNLQAQDINVLIDNACNLLFPLPITDNQKDYLKYILLNGLPDFEWTVEWMQYSLVALNETDPTSIAMRKKLENFFFEIMNMAEYHLI